MHIQNRIAMYSAAFMVPLMVVAYSASSSGQKVSGGQVLKQVADIPMSGPGRSLRLPES